MIYNGLNQTIPLTVKVGDKTIESTGFDVQYKNNKDVGNAEAIVTLKGNYSGSEKYSFRITKANNSLAVSAKAVKIKAKKLKKKNQKLDVSNMIIFANRGQGQLNYSIVSAKKGKKSFKKYFKINAETGQLTVKKRLKKGTYKVNVNVSASGDKNYNPSVLQTVMIKVKVK